MPKTVNAVIFRSSVYFFACPTSFLAIAKLPTKNTPLKQTETLSDFSEETFDIDRWRVKTIKQYNWFKHLKSSCFILKVVSFAISK